METKVDSQLKILELDEDSKQTIDTWLSLVWEIYSELRDKEPKEINPPSQANDPADQPVSEEFIEKAE